VNSQKLQRRIQAAEAQGGDQRNLFAAVNRRATDGTLATPGAPIQPGQRQIDARFINELVTPHRKSFDFLRLLGAGLLDSWGVAFARVERLFSRQAEGLQQAAKRRSRDGLLVLGLQPAAEFIKR
jgi:hypothetical protein